MTEKGNAYKLAEAFEKYKKSIGKKAEPVRVEEKCVKEKASSAEDDISKKYFEGRSYDSLSSDEQKKFDKLMEEYLATSKETSTMILASSDMGDEELTTFLKELTNAKIKFELRNREVWIDDKDKSAVNDVVTKMYL